MAIGETQSQYLLAASVIQPSTRIAGSCFCVCLMFPSLKSDASGQGHHTWSGSKHSLSDSFQARLLCGSVYVYVCVCPCLLWNVVQKSLACVRIAKEGEKKKRKFYESCYREVLLCRDIFWSFSWNLCIFPRFLPGQLIMRVCFALWDDGSALIRHFYVTSTESLSGNLCLEGGGRWDVRVDERRNVFLKFGDFSFLKK